MKIGNYNHAFAGFSSTRWSISVPDMLTNAYAQALYHQYQVIPDDKDNPKPKTFAAYLHANKAYSSTANSVLMTRYAGAPDFAFSEGIRMKATSVFSDSSYFKNWEFYNIDVGTGSKVEQKYYQVHDKVLIDEFNMATGKITPNKMAGARAFYGESHGTWVNDEVWEFNTDNKILKGIKTTGDEYDYYDEYRYRIDFSILRQKGVRDMNGDDVEDPENPFYAFDAASLPEGVADQIGPVYDDTYIKPVTKVVFNSNKYTYTGKEIKPKVTVKAGKKTVPASGYTVTYDENKEIGYGTVTVIGNGKKYSGMVSESFQIAPKGTELGKIKIYSAWSGKKAA